MKIFTFLLTILILVSTINAQRGWGNVKIVDENGQNREVELYAASYALVIGASNYNSGWQKLRGVRDDVPAVSKALTKQGFIVEEAIDPTSENLLSIINNFVNKYGFVENNRILIYFAGHGYTDMGGDGRKFGYIVPIDAPDPNKKRIEFQQKAVTMDEIETVARRIRSKHALFIFDSCFSGSLVSRSKTVVPPIINYLLAQPVRQFITAGADNQEVPDESIFRQMFVRALDGDADTNRDGYITGTELAVYLQEQVIYYRGELQTPQYGKIRDPRLDRGDFIFTLPPPPTVAVNPVTTNSNISNNRTKAATIANQALTEMLNGNFNEAERLANQALQLDDNSALGYGIRGWCNYYKNEDQSSNKDLEKSIQLDSNNPLFYARLVKIYSICDYDLAKQIANQGLVKLSKPTNAVDYYAKGLIFDFLNTKEEAIQEYTNAIKKDSRLILAYNNRGTSYYHNQQYDLAIRDFTKAIDFNPNFAVAYYNRGISFNKKQQYDLAFKDFNKAIELNPNYINDILRYGDSYFENQKYELAIRIYSKIIEINPHNVSALGKRGDSYFNANQFEFSIVDYTKIIELKSSTNIDYYHYWRGQAYLNKEQNDLAKQDFDKAIEFNPNYVDAYNNRGYLYDKKKEYDLAIRDYTKAIEIDSKNTVAYNYRGKSYVHKKEYELAIQDFTKAIEIDPKYSSPYYSRANMYYNKKEYNLAIDDYTKYISLNPNDPDVYNDRADAYDKIGQKDKAEADRKKYKELGGQ